MHPLEASLQAQLEAFKDFKVEHPRLEEMDRALMRAIHGHRSYTLPAQLDWLKALTNRTNVLHVIENNKHVGCHLSPVREHLP